MSVKIVKGGGGPTFANALGVTGKPHLTLIKTDELAVKQDAEVLSGSDIEKDDVFEPFFFDPAKGENQDPALMRPPFDPTHLLKLTQNNNTLGQLITAMEINIDGTGWIIEKTEAVESGDEQPDDDKERERLTDWFKEPFPRVSFTTIRRELRRDLEGVGYGYLEVLRSLDGDLTFVKHIPANQVRMVKLDEAVPVTNTVKRNGEDVEILMNVRERRYAQKQGTKLVYFKEYGASRELNRNTGEWAASGIEAKDRATEILRFIINEDAVSPYGVPRWVNQIPSVLGSRKAEELNLDFFNAGGLPPAMIFIQGGELTSEMRKQLQAYLSGKGSSYHRAAVLEVHSSGGTIDSPGSVRVTVERFGSERMSDSMFENYDERCEERVRSSFRLPPIFVGAAQDYSFATAFASYTVAEAQIFAPERAEFDEIINNTLMRELDESGDYRYRSLPMTVNDVQTQLKALEITKDKLTSEGFVEAINEATGMNLKADDKADMVEGADGALRDPMDPDPVPEPAPVPAVPAAAVVVEPAVPTPNRRPARQVVTKWDTFELMELVNRWAHSQLTDEVSAAEVANIQDTIRRMDSDTRIRFDGYATMRMMSGLDNDFEGAIDLVGAASEIADGCQN